MNPNELQQRIKELEIQVEILLAFMKEKKQQQITYPLDEASKNVINGI